MNKDANRRPRKKVRKRIRLTVEAKTVTQYLVIAVATVLVVGMGVFVPAFFLRRRSAPDHLPSGYADIDEIRLYGAAYERSEQAIDDAIEGYYNFMMSYGSMVDISSTTYRDIALYGNGYSQISIRDNDNEFLYELANFLREEVGYEPAEQLEIRDISEDVVLVGGFYRSPEGFVLDTTSGIPIVGHMEFLSECEDANMPQLFYQIVEMYNQYTGLDFMIEPESAELEDDYYYNSIMTSDDEELLCIEITRTQYYPTGNGPDAEPRYLWTIDMTISNSEVPLYCIGAVG